MEKILFLMLIFALLLPNLGSGDELTGAVLGKVNLTVPAFVIIKHPEINRTYSSTNSTIFLNITFTDPAASCWRSANNGNNETLENRSTTSWFQNVYTGVFGFNNISVYCNNTIGNLFYNRTRFFLENSTFFISSIINISFLSPGESLSDYVKVSNFNVSVFEKDFYRDKNISLEVSGQIGILIHNQVFESDKANITIVKYEKAPPRVPSVSSVTTQRELKYFDARAFGFSSGFAVINLSYQESEISGYNETTLSVFRKSGNSWVESNITSRDETENKIIITENVTILNETIFAITGTPVPRPVIAPLLAVPTDVGITPIIIKEIVVIPPKPDQISVDKVFIRTSLSQGETKSESVEITNIFDEELNVSITVEDISNFVIPSEFDFKLKPKERKTIILNVVAFEKIKPDVYSGRLIIKAGYTKKTVDILIGISSAKRLFDVFLDIPDELKKTRKGDTVLAKIRLIYLGDSKINVKLRYGIRHFGGSDLIANEEVVEVEAGTKIESIKSFKADFNPGKYVFYVTATSEDAIAIASDLFEVVEREINILPIIYVASVIIILSILIIKEYLKHRKRLKKQLKKPIEPEDLIRMQS